MKHDVKITWHPVHVSDENAKPMVGKFSGMSIIILIASLAASVITLFILTKDLKLSLLPAAALAGVLPISTMAFLLTFVVGKPKNYCLRWVEHRQIKRKKQSLLTEINTNEK